MTEPEVILVFGRICSGKSSHKTSSYRIIVSNLVRDLVNSSSRDDLQNTMHLDNQIAQEIVGIIKALIYCANYLDIEHKSIVVDGIRQSSIVNKVLESYPQATLVWLEVPTAIRKKRYESRKAKKDTQSFDIADNKPIELECQKIYSIFNERLQIINNND